MKHASTFTVFAGDRRFASGLQAEVIPAMRAAIAHDAALAFLSFDDLTGRQIDFDLRDRAPEPAGGELPADAARRTAGRPKLGVVAREITLLPRHWEWLGAQPGGASVTLRKLVDTARTREDEQGAVRRAKAAADCFMGAMLGNAPGYEDATRALYAGNRDRFFALSEEWPADLRDHARRLAAPALPSN
jgi:hypothetical protein